MPLNASSSDAGIAPSITAQPMAPRLTTSVADVSERTLRSDAMMSVLPPAMLNSSIVPIARSIFGRMRCRCAVTPSDGMKRVSPSPRFVSPHSTGR